LPPRVRPRITLNVSTFRCSGAAQRLPRIARRAASAVAPAPHNASASTDASTTTRPPTVAPALVIELCRGITGLGAVPVGIGSRVVEQGRVGGDCCLCEQHLLQEPLQAQTLRSGALLEGAENSVRYVPNLNVGHACRIACKSRADRSVCTASL